MPIHEDVEPGIIALNDDVHGCAHYSKSNPVPEGLCKSQEMDRLAGYPKGYGILVPGLGRQHAHPAEEKDCGASYHSPLERFPEQQCALKAGHQRLKPLQGTNLPRLHLLK